MTTNKKKVGVLGYGEVGKAIASFYEAPLIKDLDRDDFGEAAGLDVLHVCIPCDSQLSFVRQVKEVIKQHAPAGLVIIHSTVPVGTTEMIAKEHVHIAHSPVRGVHPNLAQGIKTFVKYIGADSAGAGRLAAEHLVEAGIPNVKVLFKSRATELLKLLDTTYYGLCIAFHAYAETLCQKEKVPFLMVMDHANMSYNAGYSILGRHDVIRPTLLPPENGKIGGHCVIPNAELLRRQFGEDPILEAILRHK